MNVDRRGERPAPGPEVWVRLAAQESRAFESALHGRPENNPSPVDIPTLASTLERVLRAVEQAKQPTGLDPVTGLDPMNYYDRSLRRAEQR